MTTGACILVPLDGSVAGEDAVPYAQALARSEHLSLHLFSVIPAYSPKHVGAGHHTTEWLERPARRAREHYLQAVAQRIAHDGLPASTEVVSGDPVEEVLQAIREDRVRLVALSTHGRGGVQRLLLGSVADKVMRLSEVPVLLVRRREPGDSHRLVRLARIAVALDGSLIAEAAIPAAAALTERGGTVILVRVVPPTEALYEHELSEAEASELERHHWRAASAYLEWVKRQQPPEMCIQTAVLHGPVAQTLMDWLEQEQIDLLVMTTHGIGGLRRLLVGSVADRLVRLGAPVLLVAAQEIHDSANASFSGASKDDGEPGAPLGTAVEQEQQHHVIIS